jgi:hypothetical protein
VTSCIVDSAAIYIMVVKYCPEFAHLHRSSPFIGALRCQAIQTEHGPYIEERTVKAVYNCDMSMVLPDTMKGVVT